ncbi:hypothetical protein Bhyg_08828 [Pseudolycoriella hygida]|uniref:Chitin-binding type-2 domain-containing protein n=1 Tax=Pseudolycoriella hygida TaxID=35572 RepID=A0A9Q0N5C4_9DIPT|nr:hypothetical protein Bhyg_08828 [Pseudolycoriella hygida]
MLVLTLVSALLVVCPVIAIITLPNGFQFDETKYLKLDSRVASTGETCQFPYPYSTGCSDDCSAQLYCDESGKVINRYECDTFNPYCVKGVEPYPNCDRTYPMEGTCLTKATNFFVCSADGLYPDPTDCTKYHVCNGTAHYIESCPANHQFTYNLVDPLTMQDPYTYPGNGEFKCRFRSTYMSCGMCGSFYCNGLANEFTFRHDDYFHYAYCVSIGTLKKVIMFKCPQGTRHEGIVNVITNSVDCIPTACPVIAIVTLPNGFQFDETKYLKRDSRVASTGETCQFPYPYSTGCSDDCSAQLYCDELGKVINRYECDSFFPYCVKGVEPYPNCDRTYPMKGTCLTKATNYFVCSADGLYPDPTDCTKYHVCNGTAHYIESCPANHQFTYNLLDKIVISCANIFSPNSYKTVTFNRKILNLPKMLVLTLVSALLVVCPVIAIITLPNGFQFDETKYLKLNSRVASTEEKCEFPYPYSNGCSDDCSAQLYCDELGQVTNRYECDSYNPYCVKGIDSYSSCDKTYPMEGTCLTKATNYFVCSADGLYPDPTDCARYHVCNGTAHYIESCPANHLFTYNQCPVIAIIMLPNGFQFDETKYLKLDSRAASTEEKCQFPYPFRYSCSDDCSALLYCDELGKVINRYECDSYTPYCVKGVDPYPSCDKSYPMEGTCLTKATNYFVCSADGVFPDPTDCTKYHVCNGTAHYIESCPVNHQFTYNQVDPLTMQDPYPGNGEFKCRFRKISMSCGMCDSFHCLVASNHFALRHDDYFHYAYCISIGTQKNIIMFKCPQGTRHEGIVNATTNSVDCIPIAAAP